MNTVKDILPRHYFMLKDSLGNQEDLRSHLFEIMSLQKVSSMEALRILNDDIAFLSKTFGVELCESVEIFGSMKAVGLRNLTLPEIIDNSDGIAGPPYLYIYWEDNEENISVFKELSVQGGDGC